MSPESRLLDVDEVDGFIAQVWTGTSGTWKRIWGTL